MKVDTAALKTFGNDWNRNGVLEQPEWNAKGKEAARRGYSTVDTTSGMQQISAAQAQKPA